MNEAVDNNAPINQGVDMYGRQKPDLLSPRECAIIAAQAANEKKATDIMVQEVRDLIGVSNAVCAAARSPITSRARPTARGRCWITAASSCMCSSPKRAITIAWSRCGTTRPWLTWKGRPA